MKISIFLVEAGDNTEAAASSLFPERNDGKEGSTKSGDKCLDEISSPIGGTGYYSWDKKKINQIFKKSLNKSQT